MAAKELRESVYYWLRLIERARLSRQAHLTALVTEGNELLAILKASARTARERAA